MGFDRIDITLSEFIKDKDISLSKDPKSDWLVFEWRQLYWKNGDLRCILEIYPEFDKNENISNWIFYGAVSYDIQETRYYYSKVFIQGKLNDISLLLPSIIDKAYNHLMNIKKENIPLAYPK